MTRHIWESLGHAARITLHVSVLRAARPDTAPDAAPDIAPGIEEATTENEKLTTGPGAGGATESAERAPHHEGVHGGPSRKG